MRELKITGKTGNSKILLGESLSELATYCQPSVIITDKNVKAAHGSHFPKVNIIEIGIGESAKTLETVKEIYEKMLELGLDRASFVVGIGGGIVCDVAGFAASTYMRGLHFGFVPTTLLSQVDASVGGKNGVNLHRYKNLVGTFNQPEFVLCDFELLKTLPEREIVNGMAEVVKHAAIGEEKLFTYLETQYAEEMALKRTAIEKAVYDSLVVKTRIVAADEKEKGERRKLNFGHTLGHAIEKATAFERLEPQFKQIENVSEVPHGKAVSIGMVAAARLSVAKGMLQKKDAERIEELLKRIGLPTKTELDKKEILDAIRKDKKRTGEKINFILLEGIGKAKIVEIELRELEGILHDLC